MGAAAAAWADDGTTVALRAGGLTLFEDTREHWQEGVLRLLGWDEEVGRGFVGAVIDATGGAEAWARAGLRRRTEALKAAGAAAFPEPAGSTEWSLGALAGLRPLGRAVDVLWTRAVAGSAGLAVAGSRDPAHGVLLARGPGGAPVLAEAPRYEEAYFEGGQAGYGYGSLERQTPWRMEKARRQARQLAALLLLFGAQPEGRPPRLLDVGSGYGYLRAAAAERGFAHEGIELSRHAAGVARRLFGFDSAAGTLADLPGSGYDCIAMMDLVEHVADPVGLLAEAARRLHPRGLVVVRTPNLLALEREVFGHRYHSFKAEHLHSFSIESLGEAMLRAGLDPVFGATEAHLLRGFLGDSTALLARRLEGSDILAAGQRRG